MITGEFTRFGGPAISCFVSIPSLNSQAARVTFLLDTGASFSIIHPKDLRSLRIDESRFSERATSRGRGIGGGAAYAEVDGRLSIEHGDGTFVSYVLPLHLALPSAVNDDFPSILGMDFISYFKLCVSLSDRLVELE